MKDNIEFQDGQATITIRLDPGESIVTAAGSMVAQSGVVINPHSERTVMGNIRRLIAGRKLETNTITGQIPGSWVNIAPHHPGDITRLEIGPQDRPIRIRAETFLATNAVIKIDDQFKDVTDPTTGQEITLLKATSKGRHSKLYLHACGTIQKIQVIESQELIVDASRLVAFEGDIRCLFDEHKGIRPSPNTKGLTITFIGPGNIWMHTHSISALDEHLSPVLSRTPTEAGDSKMGIGKSPSTCGP